MASPGRAKKKTTKHWKVTKTIADWCGTVGGSSGHRERFMCAKMIDSSIQAMYKIFKTTVAIREKILPGQLEVWSQSSGSHQILDRN